MLEGVRTLAARVGGLGMGSTLGYLGSNAGEIGVGIQRWTNLVATHQDLGMGRIEFRRPNS
jgi:hypothetical protein